MKVLIESTKERDKIAPAYCYTPLHYDACGMIYACGSIYLGPCDPHSVPWSLPNYENK